DVVRAADRFVHVHDLAGAGLGEVADLPRLALVEAALDLGGAGPVHLQRRRHAVLERRGHDQGLERRTGLATRRAGTRYDRVDLGLVAEQFAGLGLVGPLTVLDARAPRVWSLCERHDRPGLGVDRGDRAARFACELGRGGVGDAEVLGQ